MGSSKETLHDGRHMGAILERKCAAVDAGEVDEADRYSYLIKRRVKQDKEEHLLEQLETITSQGYKWDGLGRLRNQFTPAFTKFKDADGNHVPFKNYPQKDAEYLRDVHSMETLFCWLFCLTFAYPTSKW